MVSTSCGEERLGKPTPICSIRRKERLQFATQRRTLKGSFENSPELYKPNTQMN
jgi:hypothetical protein